jgi:hypothetical protein
VRSPDPLAECRPGGTCPVCNAGPDICPECGDEQVEAEGEKRCRSCREAREEYARDDAAEQRREP